MPPLYLIMPPQHGLLAGFATGLLCLKKHLERVLPEQFVEILDLSGDDEDLVASNVRDLAAPDGGSCVFGITTTTASYQAALLVARCIKGHFGADATIVLGGPHASADAATILKTQPDIDFVIRGEGERALEAFLRSWPHVETAPNLVHRTVDGVAFNEEAPLLQKDELDTLVVDDDWFLEQAYAGKFDRFTFVSARGCPLKCRFCSVSNQAIRVKSPEVVADEVRRIVAEGYDRIAIEDNFFTQSLKRTRAVCAELAQLQRQGVQFSWDCQTRVEAAARPGVADMLAEAGCDAVYLGVEALSARALEFLGKTPHAERYVDLLCDVVIPEMISRGVDVYLNLQFGLPADVADDPQLVRAVLRRVGAYSHARSRTVTVFPQLFVVYPGTQHFADYVAAGVLWDTVFEDFTAWESKQGDLTAWIGKYFAHGAGGLPLGILQHAALARGDFELDHERTLQVQTNLAALDVIEGVKAFRYSDYLAPLARRPIDRRKIGRTVNSLGENASSLNLHSVH